MEIKKIVKLTDEQYSELLINGQIVVDGVIKYWEDGTLYVSDSALSNVSLRNIIDKGLIKPNKLNHEQFITPKITEIIKEKEYPENYPHIPDYEWNYAVLKGIMTKGDYFRVNPVGSDDYGDVYVWNNAQWEKIDNDYECTTENEESILLKVYAGEAGYNKKITLSRGSFKFDIVELGLHSTSENVNGSRRYSIEFELEDLFYEVRSLYCDGNFHITDTKLPNKIEQIEVNGYLSNILFAEGFGSLISIKAKGINRIDYLGCPQLKTLYTDEIIPEMRFQTPSGYTPEFLYKIEHLPKAYTYTGSCMRFAAADTANYMQVEANLNFPCSVAGSCFDSCGFARVVIGEEVFSWGSQALVSSKTKYLAINAPLDYPSYAFYANAELIEVYISNKVSSFNSTSFQGCGNMVDVRLEEGFNANGLNLSITSKLSPECLVQMIPALKDLTGQSSKTLTLGTTNKNKFFTKKISYADDLGKWEIDDGQYVFTYNDEEKAYRVSGKPETITRVSSYTYGDVYVAGEDYIYEDGYLRFIGEHRPVLNTDVLVLYTSTAQYTPQQMASMKNWNIA